MEIAVIIPTYNRAHTLARALDSVLAQTLQPAELLVVDDGSRDGTPLWMKREYPDVPVTTRYNGGVSAARNMGIRETTAEWIAFLDSDDEWYPEKLERQAAAIEAAGAPHFICHTDEIWIRKGKRVNPMDKHAKAGGWIFQRCLPLCAISPSAVMIHRSVFERVGLFDPDLPACEDYDMWLRICSRYPVLYVDEKLVVKYGGHDDQLSKQHWGMDRFRVWSLEKAVEFEHLGEEDHRAAIDMLIKKTEILLAGARKRDKWSTIKRYESILEMWTPEDPSPEDGPAKD